MKLNLFPLKLYFSRLSIALLFLSSLALNLFIWVWLWLKIPHNMQDLFLHYNVLFGVDSIGNSWQVFYLPLLGLIILIVNYFLGWILYNRDKFIAQTLNFISLLSQIFVLIGSFLLIFLNT